jgi:hypothetical protein
MVKSWGVWGHSHINHAAVFALPEEIRRFYFNHIDFITEESTIPDLRKYTLKDKAESPRHFIDLEEYGGINGQIPASMEEALKKYDDKVRQEQGILPWYIQEMTSKLTNAFKSGRRNEILFLSADLGHYIADANMPLHTSTNHDGQLTGQRGIHSFWEAQLPEYFGSAYLFNVSSAEYVQDVTAFTWNIIRHSHGLIDSLLIIEKRILNDIPESEHFKLDEQGAIAKNMFDKRVYSEQVASRYHSALNGMVEAQMKNAIKQLADLWYTAWVNAGKPDLKKLDAEEVFKANEKEYKRQLKSYKKGKLSGFLPEKEYR